MSNTLWWPGNDTQAVKTYGLLYDAGYYCSLELDWRGFTLIWGVKPKTSCR